MTELQPDCSARTCRHAAALSMALLAGLAQVGAPSVEAVSPSLPAEGAWVAVLRDDQTQVVGTDPVQGPRKVLRTRDIGGVEARGGAPAPTG